jgi:hypothetical protein
MLSAEPNAEPGRQAPETIRSVYLFRIKKHGLRDGLWTLV